MDFTEMENHEIDRNGKSYKCDICEKEFSQKSNLNTHVKGVHENSKKQKCDICNVSFCDLRRHIKVQHQKIFTKVLCDLCHKEIRKTSLN